jgi:enterochelin esterase family protein
MTAVMRNALTASLFVVVPAFVARSLAALAQNAAPTPVPPPRPTPPVVSPEVSPDRKVTVRVRAPSAREVAVSGQFVKDRTLLTRGADGLWTLTVGPVEPGLYEYSLFVDGFRTVDTANPVIKPTRVLGTSILEVPGTPPLLTEFQDVPHGALVVHQYRSRALEGRTRRLHVYTPPDYEKKSGQKYPVLYLIHGSGDNDACWTQLGHAHQIFDNLIAQKKVRPMVVVMPDAHALPPQPPSPAGAGPSRGLDNLRAFERDLLQEVLPLVESRYRVKTDPQSRAIAGLSLGGSEALAVGLNHADKFAWVGSMSSAGAPELLEPALANPAALDRKLKWLWLGCGKDDTGTFTRMSDLVKTLTEKKIKHTWFPTDGGHAWPVWRNHLIEIAPQLFNPAALKPPRAAAPHTPPL